MADVMGENGKRCHWYQFKVFKNGQSMGANDMPVWRRDNEDTDDYFGPHPAMLARALDRLRDKHGDDCTFEFSTEVHPYG